jgi:hypothetical protein
MQNTTQETIQGFKKNKKYQVYEIHCVCNQQLTKKDRDANACEDIWPEFI